LGVCYLNGHGIAQDYNEAVKWVRKAAEQGDANGQSNLGVCYFKGHGVAKDDAEAVKWFLKAAMQGDANAEFCLAVACNDGRGTVISIFQNSRSLVRCNGKNG
jgi:TPR repeat protein